MVAVILYNLEIALEAITQNRLRSFLTSLGIIFGVASVIAMLAIGNGAQHQILEQMRTLGTNNIIIQPVIEQEEGSVADDQLLQTKEKKRFSPGLTISDMESILETVPEVTMATAELISDVTFIRSGLRQSGKLVGVNLEYFQISVTQLYDGNLFNDAHFSYSMPVCVVGKNIQTRFFAGENPIGKQIKAGSNWFTIIGVLDSRSVENDKLKRLGIRDFDMDIYIPVSTYLIRHKNRSFFSAVDIKKANAQNSSGNEEGIESDKNNYHQIDRIIIRVDDSNWLRSVADVIARKLERRHNDIVDFEVVIPEQLLKQEQQTKRIFNIVLSSIASISLLVGGIGIMNIMFASVVERYKEIGTRMAIGARKLDIQLQFLTEALVISLSGGIIGIITGISISYLIEEITGIYTLVSIISIVISFGVSISVGLIFGIFPAMKAAEQEPADVLRYE